jgi:hypothetical protein
MPLSLLLWFTPDTPTKVLLLTARTPSPHVSTAMRQDSRAPARKLLCRLPPRRKP